LKRVGKEKVNKKYVNISRPKCVYNVLTSNKTGASDIITGSRKFYHQLLERGNFCMEQMLLLLH